jgi:hypothetical protein
MLLASAQDFQLFQMMNNLTREKYTEMSVVTQRLIQQVTDI